jgi:hypothetical protein
MKFIKGIFVTGLILLGCFETLQFFNKQDALSVGKNFLKAHNATVESIDCHVPARAALDQSGKICVFKATPKQIQVLTKNIGFRLIDSRMLSDEEIGRIQDKFNRKEETKVVVDAVTRMKLYDWRQSSNIENHSCWATLSLKNRSELELYGISEDKKSRFRHDFFIFYKKTNTKGCFVFFPYLEGELGMNESN